MRIGKIELMRFLGAVLIMNAHFGYQDRPFQLSWFFVEFFYIITGYLYNNRIFYNETFRETGTTGTL